MRKKYIIGLSIGGVLAGGYLVARYKFQKIEKLLNNLIFSITKVDNLFVSFSEIRGQVHIEVYNPANQDLKLNTFFAKMKQIRVFNKNSNKLLATSKLDTKKIIIRSKKTFILPVINLSIPLLESVATVITEMSKEKKEFSKLLRFEVDLELVGYKKTLIF